MLPNLISNLVTMELEGGESVVFVVQMLGSFDEGVTVRKKIRMKLI